MNYHRDIQVYYDGAPVKTEMVSSTMKRSKQRHVKFEKVVHTYGASSIDIQDLTEEEIELCWYTPNDYVRFRSDDKKLMRVYRGLIKQKRLASDRDIIDKLDERIDEMADEVRGLEDYKSLQVNVDTKQRRKLYSSAVFKEQMRQKTLFILSQGYDNDSDEWNNSFVLDAVSMRESVVGISMKSKLISYKHGLADAKYVRQMNGGDDSDSVVTETSSSSDETNEQSLHVRTILEANEHKIVRIPPPCHDLDETHHSPRSQRYGRVTASAILRRYQLPYLIVQNKSTSTESSLVTCV